MKDIEIYGLKSAGGSSAAFPISIDVDDKVVTKSSIVGIARTVNPTAVSDAAEVRASFDDLGRQVMTLYQVRDLIATGSATLTLAQETTILGGVASTLQDVIMVTGANTSGVALRVDLRYGTGGSVIDSIVIPANDVVSKNYVIPYPMSEVAQAVTAKLNASGEISDSPITITMIAIKNI